MFPSCHPSKRDGKNNLIPESMIFHWSSCRVKTEVWHPTGDRVSRAVICRWQESLPQKQVPRKGISLVTFQLLSTLCWDKSFFLTTRRFSTCPSHSVSPILSPYFPSVFLHCNEWHSFHARVGRFSPFLYLRSVAIAVILFWLQLVVLVSPCFLGSRIPRDYRFPRAPLFLCSERKPS